MTEQEIRRSEQAVAHAIAQQELEGLTVPPETVADLHRIARGEMTIDEALDSVHRRYANVPVLR